MGITNRSLEQAIGSTEAAALRGKIGVEKGNKLIQELHNSVHHSSNERHCGYDYDD